MELNNADERDFNRRVSSERRTGVISTLRDFHQKRQEAAARVAHEAYMKKTAIVSEQNADQDEAQQLRLRSLREQGTKPADIQKIDTQKSVNLLDEQEDYGLKNLRSMEPVSPEVPKNVVNMVDSDAWKRRIAEGKAQALQSAQASEQKIAEYTAAPTPTAEKPRSIFQRIFSKFGFNKQAA